MTYYRSVILLIMSLLFSACAAVRRRDEITQLNAVFTIPPKQKLFVYNRQGQVLSKELHRRASAALYEKGDTLYAEFIGSTMPKADTDPKTLDQSDSSAILFVHYIPVLHKIEERSPWFTYRTTAFDMDLTTMPLRYRFATGGLPGQLNDYNLNINLHVGFRTDIGRYRTTYFRRSQQSDIKSYSIGLGGIIGLSPTSVNSFNTNGRVADDYQALGISYGLSTTFSFSTFSAGLAVGYEKLADRNNAIWIYDNKPWVGLTLGVNLN